MKIVSRWDSTKILYQAEAESFKILIEAAIKAGANLRSADLRSADLSSADLSFANLRFSNLHGFFSFGPGGSRNSYTWARWEDKGYMVHCGCLTSTLVDFEKAVGKEHGNNEHAQWYLDNIRTMKGIANRSKKEFEARKKADAPEGGGEGRGGE